VPGSASVTHLRTRPLANFGWYRLMIALGTIVLRAAGAI